MDIAHGNNYRREADGLVPRGVSELPPEALRYGIFDGIISFNYTKT